MQLWEQGKLRLDDSVAMYLPDFKVKQDFESVPITIRGLLTHIAGLPRESAQSYWTSPFIFPTEKEINGKLGEQRTLYPSSREFQYSNLGMTLLGQIVAKVSGMPVCSGKDFEADGAGQYKADDAERALRLFSGQGVWRITPRR